MAILKYVYLAFGLGLFLFMNVLSYTREAYAAPLSMKVLFSSISLVLLTIDYTLILFEDRFLLRPLATHTRIILYIGVVVIPLISLYYA